MFALRGEDECEEAANDITGTMNSAARMRTPIAIDVTSFGRDIRYLPLFHNFHIILGYTCHLSIYTTAMQHEAHFMYLEEGKRLSRIMDVGVLLSPSTPDPAPPSPLQPPITVQR
jgi:hypothetical protein